MSAGDRLTNPLGFQVIRYRRNAELPSEPPAANPAPAAVPEATAAATMVRPSQAVPVPAGAAGTVQ
jgi:type IV secretion system protein VirB8